MNNIKKIKRINLNVPLEILREVDKLAKDGNQTRTDVFVNGVLLELEEVRRKKKLKQFISQKKSILNQKDNKEMFELGGNEWVKKIREEWE